MKFRKGSVHTDESKAKMSEKLRGNKRRWKGGEASYTAIHIWIKKYWGKPDHCDICHCDSASRFEWCNKDKQYRRVRQDWLQMCPSCHRKYDARATCPKGHMYTPQNTKLNCRGHRLCLRCLEERRNATNN